MNNTTEVANEIKIDLSKANVQDSVSIVIVHKDKPEYLNIALQSIAVNSINNNYEIIVVDNASGMETQTFLDELEKDVKVVRSDKNIYFSAAANLGFRHADKNSKYIIFLHADVVILNPAWIDLMINVAEANKSGFVGLESGSYFIGNQKAEFVQEWCLLLTRQCFEKIHGFPEQLPLVGNAFIATLRAQQELFKPQVMKNNIAHHYKVFGIDVNTFEKLSEEAMALLPKIVSQSQSRAVNN
jgi:glycosyltransferase involved in cell wall biosynthesis